MLQKAELYHRFFSYRCSYCNFHNNYLRLCGNRHFMVQQLLLFWSHYQMDNTYKDNKNRYVMAYCNMLVDLGVFDRVELNFLPVGHTHCDVDQLFSRIAVALRGTYCLNFAHLLEVFL